MRPLEHAFNQQSDSSRCYRPELDNHETLPDMLAARPTPTERDAWPQVGQGRRRRCSGWGVRAAAAAPVSRARTAGSWPSE